MSSHTFNNSIYLQLAARIGTKAIECANHTVVPHWATSSVMGKDCEAMLQLWFTGLIDSDSLEKLATNLGEKFRTTEEVADPDLLVIRRSLENFSIGKREQEERGFPVTASQSFFTPQLKWLAIQLAIVEKGTRSKRPSTETRGR